MAGLRAQGSGLRAQGSGLALLSAKLKAASVGVRRGESSQLDGARSEGKLRTVISTPAVLPDESDRRWHLRWQPAVAGCTRGLPRVQAGKGTQD